MSLSKNIDINTFVTTYFDKRIVEIDSFENITSQKNLVYIVTHGYLPIVVGSHTKKRAINVIKGNHLKSIFIQIYKKYGSEKLRYYYIEAEDSKEAKEIEKKCHRLFGGNSRLVKEDVFFNFKKEYKKYPHVEKYIKQAILSSHDGLSDLQNWYNNEIITKEEWEDIQKIFNVSKKKSRTPNPLGNCDIWKEVLTKLGNGGQ